ncbi:MAG TPA: hypothetical protein VID19_00850 [Candidatus Eremiobacteraceae bacterium]
MPSSGTHPNLGRYIAASLSAMWAAIGVASAIGAALAEGASANAVSGFVANALLGAAAWFAFIDAKRWRVAVLISVGLVTLQRYAAVIGYGGATDAVIAATLALIGIAGATLIGVKPKQH